MTLLILYRTEGVNPQLTLLLCIKDLGALLLKVQIFLRFVLSHESHSSKYKCILICIVKSLHLKGLLNVVLGTLTPKKLITCSLINS